MGGGLNPCDRAIGVLKHAAGRGYVSAFYDFEGDRRGQSQPTSRFTLNRRPL